MPLFAALKTNEAQRNSSLASGSLALKFPADGGNHARVIKMKYIILIYMVFYFIRATKKAIFP